MAKKDKDRTFWSAPPMWKGETVFIIGGGPSLLDLDLTPIHSRAVLGCNNAFELGPWVDVTYFGDKPWWFWNQDKLLKYSGLIVTSNDDEFFEANPRIKVMRREMRFGISKNPSRVCWNKNTGGSSINLAVHFGAKRIVLLGFDMKVSDNGRAGNWGHNWHDNHKPHKGHKPTIYQKNMLPHFVPIKKVLDELGIECINANMGSALEIFQKIPLEEVLG